MEEAALLARTEWAAVMLEEAAVTTELCRDNGSGVPALRLPEFCTVLRGRSY
jgi:hypothetical protein